VSHALPADARSGSIERSGVLTPFAFEGIVEDALWMGRGARLEIRVPEATPDEHLAWIEERLAALGRRGILVDVGRDARVEGPAPSPAATPRRPRVAVAEDSAELRKLIATTLRGDGYDVVEAGDGVELIARLEALSGRDGPARDAVELIVSDLRMPGLSGMEILGAIRDGNWRTPFILITAFGDQETHDVARELGAAAVLDKPFDLQELRTLVRASVPAATPGG
jgi:CheY-like chemotaxis protein